MKFSGRFLHDNDTAGKYPNSYYAATANTALDLPCQQGEEAADVCIIGAGFTGLSAALQLAKSGLKVILLDAHRVGWGASGRNGGQLATGQRVEQGPLEKMVGREDARKLWDLSLESVALCKKLIKEHQIDCDLTPGVLHVDHKPAYVPETKEYVEKLQTQYDYSQIRFVDREEVREMVGSNAYYGGSLDSQSAHIHPLNFALGLAKAALKAGVTIYEQSAVLRYTKTDPAIVTLKNGVITAKFVLLACNGYLDDLDKKVARKIMPINNYIAATEPLSEQLARSLIRDNVAVADSKFVINYFRLSADNRMLFGGGESYRFKFPSDIKQFVTKPMLEIYPQLKGLKLDYAWGGTLGITVNRMPYFDKLAPNVLCAMGYSGHGIGMATLGGKLMGEVIQGQVERFDIMAKVKTHSFPGGTLLRWPGLVLAMTYYSIRDKL
ncbi:MAG: gamma-glutamylputrescine oxidoreductase [Osedax symbiont Rs1]|nr:MAG: gamma-glutamylputrescine oxidoreductase [Osedax symbiont Rs1]